MKLSLLLVLVTALASAQKDFEVPEIEDPFFDGKEQYGGLTTVNPGLKIRLSQGLTDILQQNLVLYGMTYLNLHLNVGEEGKFFINVWPLNLEFNVYEVIQEPVQIDFSSFLFQFTESPLSGDPVVMLAAPIIKNWAYTMKYVLKIFGFQDTGNIRLSAANATAMAAVETKALHNGLFYPQLHFLRVDFGDTEVFVMNAPFKQWFLRQGFDFVKYALMDAINRFGKTLLNLSFARETQYYLNN